MRTLTAAATAAKNATTASPRLILEIEWGGAGGTAYYSDVPLGSGDGSSALHAEGRVGSWGSIAGAVTESTTSPVGDVSVELLDADHSLLAVIKEIEPQRKPAAVYQHFMGGDAADLVPLLRGIINHPVGWHEAEATLTFDITDISTWFQRTIGTLADRETFPDVADEAEGQMLPMVYGNVERVPGVHVAAGAQTILWRSMLATDMVFYADRGDFPEDAEITLWVDQEQMTGTWHGNTFTVSERGLTLHRGVTSGRGTKFNIIDRSLPHTQDNEYRGHTLHLTGPGGDEQWRAIRASNLDTDSIWYMPAFHDADGFEWIVAKNATFAITSYRAPHAAGAPVRRDLDGYVYVVNDAPSEAVDYVEVWGKVAQARAGARGSAMFQDIEGWVRVDPSLYTVDLNDTTSFPALDHAVTTVAFSRNPAELKDSYSNRLVARVRGVETDDDGTGTAYTNPSQIIRAIATRRMGLVEGADLDTDSFDDAEATLASYPFAFALSDTRDALDLLADLAVQCRSQCVWEAGKLTLRLLPTATPAPSVTLDASVIAADSLARQHTPLDQVVTEYVGTFRPTCVDDPQRVVSRDSTAAATYGHRAAELDLWAFQSRTAVQRIVAFWLHRHARVYEDISVETMLTSLELERLDPVQLDWPDHFPSGQRAQVLAVDHVPGSGTEGQIDTIRLSLRAPVGQDECETQDEDGSVEECGDTCESEGCQLPAELFCTGFCDGQCTAYCQVHDCDSAEDGCGGCESQSCETGACEADGCESGGLESDCGDCEFWDETGCGDAEAACASCVASCMASCTAGGAEPELTVDEQGCSTCCRTYNCQTACMCGGTEECEFVESGDCGETGCWCESGEES